MAAIRKSRSYARALISYSPAFRNRALYDEPISGKNTPTR